MKKFYTTLALAAVVALGASAASRDYEKMQVIPAEVFEANISFEATAPVVKTAPAAAPAKTIPSNMEELCDMYNGTFEGMLTSNEGENSIGLTLSPVDGQPTKVSIVGFIGEYPVIGDVDFTNHTIKIPKQDLFLNTRYNQMVYFCWMKPNYDTKKYEISEEPYTLYFSEDDVLRSSTEETESFFACRIAEGYFEGGCLLNTVRFVIPDFDLETWTQVGTAKFQDAGWLMSGFFGYDNAMKLPMQEVEYYTKTAINDFDEEEHTYIALYQPYGWFNNFVQQNFPEDYEAGFLNESAVTGAIVIDITFPQAVIVNQNVYSGAKIEGDYFWPYNQEYVEFYINEFDADDIAAGLDEVSTYDEGAKLIEITNCYFGLNADPTAQYRWVNKEQEPLPTTVLVQLEGGTNAINSVIANENAPVEYYNLQGVRVADDTKGLVIRKQGSDVAKIVR